MNEKHGEEKTTAPSVAMEFRCSENEQTLPVAIEPVANPGATPRAPERHLRATDCLLDAGGFRDLFYGMFGD